MQSIGQIELTYATLVQTQFGFVKCVFVKNRESSLKIEN